MRLLDNRLYLEDVEYAANLPLPWEKLKGGRLLVAGASGMIGSFLVDTVMYRNIRYGDKCGIIALGRDEQKARSRFEPYWSNADFSFAAHDINSPLPDLGKADFIINAASNTHPVLYASDPIGTIAANVIGTYNLLNYSAVHNTRRFLFASSVEVYGENRGDADKFDESYCGYIDCNTLRAGYPESKRAAEALCQAFIRQQGLDVVIARLSRTYGPTMQSADSKAVSQFIKKGVLKEDLILKSAGTQFYSYSYVADAASGILTALLGGNTGEAYNIADEASNITLGDMAKIIAEHTGKKIVYETPDALEATGYSKATRAVMDSGKLKRLGWKAKYDIRTGLVRTVEILSELDRSTL